MKKIYELIKPFLSIVLGALMLLEYMNFLGAGGAALALGIIAVIFAAYYLVVGILSVVIGPKLGPTKRILDVVGISLFPLFFFVYRLLIVISGGLGVTGWILDILGMVGALACAVFVYVAAFSKGKVIKRLALLFAMIFVLVLLLALLFDFDGAVIGLGAIILVDLFSYLAYGAMLFMFVTGLSKEAVEPAPEEKPEEEPKAEEEPKVEE